MYCLVNKILPHTRLYKVNISAFYFIIKRGTPNTPLPHLQIKAQFTFTVRVLLNLSCLALPWTKMKLAFQRIMYKFSVYFSFQKRLLKSRTDYACFVQDRRAVWCSESDPKYREDEKPKLWMNQAKVWTVVWEERERGSQPSNMVQTDVCQP